MANKSSIEAGRGHVSLATDSTALEKGLAAAQATFQAWGKSIAISGAAIGAAGAAITTPFLMALGVFAGVGQEFTIASRRVGIEFGQLQQLSHATGGDLDTLSGSLDKMDSFLQSVANGSEEAARSLAMMGLSFEDLNRMNQHDRFLALADGLNRIADAGQRSAVRRQVLGRGAGTLNISGGAEGIREREARAIELGRVFSPQDQAAVQAYNLAQRELSATMTALWSTIGATIAPFMTEFTQLVTQIVQHIRNWVNENRELVLLIFRVGDVMVTAGTVIGVLGGIIYGLSYAFTFVSGAIGIVSSVLSFILAPAIALISFGFTVLWGILNFAAGGFGIITLASWAWSAATVASSVIATAAMWAWAAGVIAWKIIVAGAYAAAAAVYLAFTWGAAAAMIAYKIAVLAGSVATFLFSLVMWETAAATTVATAGINILVASLGAMAAILVGGFALAFLSPFLAVGGAIWAAVKGVFALGGILGRLSSTTSGIGSALSGMASMIGGAFSDAASQTASSFGQIWPAITSGATRAWGGIKDAFVAGDWVLLWEIIKTTALLVWEQIKAPVFLMLNSWGDAFEDTFTSIWTSLKIIFAEGWAFVKAGWYGVLLGILNAWEDVQESIAVSTERALHPFFTDEDRARTAADRDDERRARTQPLTDSTAAARDEMRLAREQTEMAEWFNRQNLDVARASRDAAIEGGDPEEIARLQTQLDLLNNQAWWQARIAEVNATMPGLGDGEGSSGFIGATKGGSSGSFFADALRGWAGASKENPVVRSNQLLEQLLASNVDLRQAIERIQRPRFS